MSEINYADVKDAANELNASGLLAKKIKTTAVSKENLLNGFITAVEALTDEQLKEMPEKAKLVYNSLPDEAFGNVAPATAEVAAATPTEAAAEDTEGEDEGGNVGDCATFGEMDARSKECKQCAKDDADMNARCKAATDAKKAATPKEKKERTPRTPKEPRAEVAMSRYGHRADSMAGMLDEMLFEGTTKEAAITKLLEAFPNRDAKLAEGKFKGHVGYLPKMRGVTVNRIESGEGDAKVITYKCDAEKLAFKGVKPKKAAEAAPAADAE